MRRPSGLRNSSRNSAETDSGFPHDRGQWISQAGVAMAVIGLTFALQ